MDFNNKSIKESTCPVGQKQIYIADSSTRGLYVQVSLSGTKTFVYRRKMGTTWRQRSIARFGEMSIPEARAKASEYNHLIASGTNVFDEAAASRSEPTFKDLFDAYVTRHADKACTTSGEMRKEFDRWLGSLGSKKASAISRKDAEKLHHSLMETPYAANRAIQLARTIYNKAITWGLFSGANPFSKITEFPEHSRDRFLSNAEAGRILLALKEPPTVDDAARALRDFILLDLFTGVRKSNLFAMSWDEIDLDAGMWKIPDTKSKNKQGQFIPLGEKEIQILKDRLAYLRKRAGVGGISPFVFPGDGKTGHQVSVQKSWVKLRDKLELQDVHLHDCRRSLAAAMASRNVNVALIKNAMNHKDMKTTMAVYARTSKTAELEARQLAHDGWLDEARRQASEPQKIEPITKAKKARR